MSDLFPNAQERADQERAYQQSLARQDQLGEAQANRNFAGQQQATAITGQRTLANDRAGYDYILQGQQGDIQANQNDARFMHENDLFDRHSAATIAQQQLGAIQAQKMAMFEAEQTNQRQGRAQDFQGNMAQYEAGVGEQSDYRRQQIAQENALHQANIQQAHELVTNDLAKGRFGYEQEIVNRYKQGALNEENMFKAKQLILQKNVEGLGKGTHRFGSEQDQVLLDKTLPDQMTAIDESPYMDEGQKREARQQVEDSAERVYMRARPLTQAEQAASSESRRAAAVQTLPPNEQNKPWRWDAKEQDIVLPRGWKPEPLGALTEAELQDARTQYDGIPDAKFTRDSKTGAAILDPNWVKLKSGQSKSEASDRQLQTRIEASTVQTKMRIEAQRDQAGASNEDKKLDNERQYHQARDPHYKLLLETIVAEAPKVKYTNWLGNEAMRPMTTPEMVAKAKEKLEEEFPASYEEYLKRHKSQQQPTGGGAISPAEFDAKWKTLKSGETLIGPDGKPYKKK